MSSKKKKPKTIELEINEGLSDGNEEPDTDEEDTYRDPPDGSVHLRPSIATPYIPSTIFVEYPPQLKMRRKDAGYVEELGDRKMGYKSHWERICIRNAFVRAGFRKSSKYWTALWSKHQNSSQLEELSCLQKVNHFPSSWCIGRKDRLSRTLNIMKRLHGNSLFDYHPDTYIMPSDVDIFVRLLKLEVQAAVSGRKATEGFWIMKPVASSCGRGISVVTSSQALALLTSASTNKKKAAAAKSMLFQKYLDNPLLINKKKFDLRIYVLVTGVDPLRVYIHKEGLTRISTSNFSLKNIKNRFAHLTNYSVNKKNAIFKAAAYEPTADTVTSNVPVGGTSENTARSSSSTRNAAVGSTGETAANKGEDDGSVNSAEDNRPQDFASAENVPGGAASANNPEMEGYKWSLHAFKAWLSAQYSPQIMQETFQRIYDIIIKTMVAMEGEITPLIQRSGVNYRTNCFELFGCDVILDENLQPHLLEVNVSPSLMGSSPLDKRIKGMLIADVLHTVGMYPYDPVLLRKYDGIRNDDTADNIGGYSLNNSAGVSRRKSVSSVSASTTAGSGSGKRVSSTNSDSNTEDNSECRRSDNTNVASNPFAFSNLSRLMNSQEAYRKEPCSENIDLDALAQSGQVSVNGESGNVNSSWWQILVLIEDEMHRAKTGGFIQVHPVLPTRPLPVSHRAPIESLLADLSSPVPYPGEYYLSLYRNARFHDHLLYKWLSLGGCRGKAGQRYLPRYVYNHIRNNLETQQDIYAELQQVGHAHFYDPNHVPATATLSGNGSAAGSKRRARSLSNPASSRPSSASIIRPTTPNPANNNGHLRSHGGEYTGGSVHSLRENVSAATNPPVSIVTTTILSMSPSGEHIQQRIVHQTVPVGGAAPTKSISVTASLPPKPRPMSRGRSYVASSSFSHSSNPPYNDNHDEVLMQSAHGKEHQAGMADPEMAAVTTLAQEYYARMSLTQRPAPLIVASEANNVNDSLVLQVPPTTPVMSGSLGSASAPTSPAGHAFGVNSGSSLNTPKAKFINPNINRNSGIVSRPISANPQQQQAGERKKTVSAAVAAAAAAFAYAYGLDPSATSKIMPKSAQPQPSAASNNLSSQMDVGSGGDITTGSQKRRSLSAPSTSRSALRSTVGVSSTEASCGSLVQEANNTEDSPQPQNLPPSSNDETGTKVLDILRQRRQERHTVQTQLSQLRDYEEKLAMQVYQQQEQYAVQQRRIQHQLEQQEALAKDHAKMKALSQAKQLTSNNMAVLQSATTLMRPSNSSTGASSIITNPSRSTQKSSILSSPLAKHMQWQQQIQQSLLMKQNPSNK